ncbi:MAG: DUF192 domain-containing protein [Verrucomicrobia bacterium]|nr:DUF192 domain-containing protein [Verrucomicrobiota bacterium]MCF7708039.1 DUF192 domain-containing protein [Verrucomicrobiota bacterium]
MKTLPQLNRQETDRSGNINKFPGDKPDRRHAYHILTAIITCLISACIGVGCGGQARQTPPPTRSSNEFHINKAQPHLPTKNLYVGTNTVTAEIAQRPIQISTGLMFRKQLEENHGMLFVFAQPHRASFYMKNTSIPLTCAYIDSEGVILEIHDMQPFNEEPITAEHDNIQFVLEMSQNWFANHGVTTGAVITADSGSLSDVFIPTR